jgi:hypothetical protein
MAEDFPGINVQHPISRKIMTGEKTIETRTYPIPQKYINCELLLIETPGSNKTFRARALGIIKFKDCFMYSTKKEFDKDIARHHVTMDSKWGWRNKPKWGWSVTVVKYFAEPIEITQKRGIVFTQKLNVAIP